MLSEYDGKVKMVYRDFPLSFHANAMPAAVAANCAGQQGKYWEMFDILMTNQRALTSTNLDAWGKDLGLDMKAYQACRLDPAQEAEIQADLDAGMALGIDATPTFFINGLMFTGLPPIEQLRDVIDRELAK